ncbi:hypothetical protein DRQ53_06685 [bacterium]|nr:MAG: hypothetical protein DRQ53_06685 [bacterium]
MDARGCWPVLRACVSWIPPRTELIGARRCRIVWILARSPYMVGGPPPGQRAACGDRMKTVLLSLVLVTLLHLPLQGVAQQSTEELPRVSSSAFFQTFDDSLSYAQFRALAGSTQLELRKTARLWLEASRDAVLASRGLGPRRGAHQVTLAERHQSLIQSMNAAATAVGYCPYMAEGWLQYADVANVLGQYQASMDCLVHAARTIPYERSEDVRRENLLKLNRVRSRASYNVEGYELALKSALYVIDHDRGAWESRLLAARCMVQLERFDDARLIIADMPEDSPNHATALSVLGVAEMQAGNLDAAERAFDAAAKKGLRSGVFENDRGRLYLEQGRPEQAIRHFRRAIDSTPNFFEARSNLAVAQRRAEDLDAAEQTLLLLIDEAPEYAPAHFNLAEVYRERALAAEATEREDWARRAWREYSLALQLGDDPERVLQRRGTLSVYVQDLDSAEEDLLALSGDPEVSVRVLTMLARVKKEQGRLDIAEQVLTMATGREDATALAWAELGEVRLRRQDAAAARPALEKACELDPALVVARVNLSIACLSLDDGTAARAALEAAAAIAPDHPLVIEQRRVLESRKAP